MKMYLVNLFRNISRIINIQGNMFIIYICSDRTTEGTYTIRNDKKHMNRFIKYYSLISKGEYKELWENNINIILSKHERTFSSITDIDYSFHKEKNYFIQEVESKECKPYNFYKVDQEDIYHLYETTIKNTIIKLKDYKDYFTLSFVCDTIDEFYQLKDS
tara:strand:+ start:1739 stop:2218 length:480 start_codon:yes stop_codon:yes gene_type:complete